MSHRQNLYVVGDNGPEYWTTVREETEEAAIQKHQHPKGLKVIGRSVLEAKTKNAVGFSSNVSPQAAMRVNEKGRHNLYCLGKDGFPEYWTTVRADNEAAAIKNNPHPDGLKTFGQSAVK